jgi:transposase
MLLWVLLIGGLAAVFAVFALILSVGRAERRARRSLYRALGLAETTIEYLMERNRDVLAELSYVRGQGEAAVSEAIEAAPSRHRNVVFLRPGLRSDRARGAEDQTPHAEEPSSSTGRTHP